MPLLLLSVVSAGSYIKGRWFSGSTKTKEDEKIMGENGINWKQAGEYGLVAVGAYTVFKLGKSQLNKVLK